MVTQCFNSVLLSSCVVTAALCAASAAAAVTISLATEFPQPCDGLVCVIFHLVKLQQCSMRGLFLDIRHKIKRTALCDVQVQPAAKWYSTRRSHIDGQVAQLRVHVPTAEEGAAASSRQGEEEEGRQQAEYNMEGGGDSRAGGSSCVLLNTVMDDDSGNEAARRHDGHQCYKCGSEGEMI